LHNFPGFITIPDIVTSTLQVHAPTNFLLLVTAKLNYSVVVYSNSVTILLKSGKVVQNLKCSAYAYTKSKVISKAYSIPFFRMKTRLKLDCYHHTLVF